MCWATTRCPGRDGACAGPVPAHDATIETLQKATAALEEALKERGFGLHRVVLPPQERWAMRCG
jgi:hypothetical protein